jgi:hypothetical protein
MNLSTRVLGSTSVHKLEAQAAEAVLTIGKDVLTRAQLAQVGCFNFTAARRLSGILADLNIQNLRQLYNDIAPSGLALPGIGVISLAVLGAAFEAKKIGGEAPLESYVEKHKQGSQKHPLVTFDTIKRRELAAQERERKDRPTARRSPPLPAEG